MPYADPEKRRQANREAARRYRERQRGLRKPVTPSGRDAGPLPVDPLPVRQIESAADVRAVLSDCIAALMRADDTARLAVETQRGRALAYIAGATLKAVELSDLEARVAELERLLAADDGDDDDQGWPRAVG